MIQGIFSAHVTGGDTAAGLMTKVNESLMRRALQARFATAVYATLSTDGQLTYCNAGHNPPVLLTRRGTRRLDTGGLILGLFGHATYEQDTMRLDPGDLLIAYSDGVTEALNAEGQEFGDERLLGCIEHSRDQSPADLLDRLLSAVRQFASGAAQNDDVTAMVLRYGEPKA
jgi:sigma-B regulation protein RsbU (phosphoserine phosphatase)